MPDVWTIIKENSSLEDGDVWEHLNNQTGGGDGFTVLADGLEIDMEDPTYDVEVEAEEFSIEVENEYDIEIEDDSLEIEID